MQLNAAPQASNPSEVSCIEEGSHRMAKCYRLAVRMKFVQAHWLQVNCDARLQSVRTCFDPKTIIIKQIAIVFSLFANRGSHAFPSIFRFVVLIQE